MHRKSRRLALMALCATTLTGGGLAVLSGPAAAWGGDCAEITESSYSTSQVALRRAALPRVSTVSVPVVTQPVLTQPMTISVNIQPAYTAPRHYRSERLVTQPISYRYRSTLFAGELAPAAFRSELSAMTLRAEQRLEAAADRAEARIQHRANKAEARIKRAAKKAERRLIRKERKLERRLERRMAQAAWRYVDP